MEWAADNERCSRGEQERDRMEIFLGSHHFLLIMKHTPPPLIFPVSAVLSIRKTEKLSDGVTAVSGTEGVSHVSDKQRMLQSLMSRWKLVLDRIGSQKMVSLHPYPRLQTNSYSTGEFFLSKNIFLF